MLTCVSECDAVDMAVDARERVAREMRVRGWSVRRVAATASERGAHVTNTTLGRYLDGGEATPKVRQAIAAAFDWSGSWPEDPPPLPDADLALDVLTRVDELERRMADIEATRDAAMPEIQANTAQIGKLWDEIRLPPRTTVPRSGYRRGRNYSSSSAARSVAAFLPCPGITWA